MDSDERPWREEALKAGILLASKIFKGRTGHGGAPASERHLKEGQLAAMLGAAFELGCEHAAARLGFRPAG